MMNTFIKQFWISALTAALTVLAIKGAIEIGLISKFDFR